MSDNVPHLTGGILFGLMLEARKTKIKVRSGCLEERTDALSETDIMKSLVDIFTGENQQMPYGSTFKKNVSDYKKCIISKTEYLPFDDSRFINLFRDSVEQNKKDTLESMSVFINEKFSEQKLKWLVSAVIETICNDETINDSENFKISPNELVSKQDLLRVEVIEIESFLLDVMRYIFVNKKDNIVGKPTFEAWYSQSAERAPWKFTNSELGKHMNDLEITRYNPSVEDIEEQEHIEDSDIEFEEEFHSNVERDDSITKQVLNLTNLLKKQDDLPSALPQQTLQQNADRIYNIEQTSNVNHIVNVTPIRKALSSNQYYNLFIIYGEKYEENSFILNNDRIFEYTNTAIGQKFNQFTLEDIDEIMSLPTLFLPEYSEANQEIKTGFFGKLVDIDKRAGNTKFDFHKECEIDLNLVELHQSELKIEDWELSRTHWAIKRANLKNILEGFSNGNETE